MKLEIKEYKDSNLIYGLDEQNLISPYDTENHFFDPKIRLGILASGNGSNFENIVKSIQKKTTKCRNSHINC